MPEKCGSSRVDELTSRGKVTQTESFLSSLLTSGHLWKVRPTFGVSLSNSNLRHAQRLTQSEIPSKCAHHRLASGSFGVCQMSINNHPVPMTVLKAICMPGKGKCAA